MSSGRFHIKSNKFPVLQQDLDECCNPGTYGKSLADFLGRQLSNQGYIIEDIFAEDFGWWIDINQGELRSHIVLRRASDSDAISDYAISIDNKTSRWSWKKFRFLDLSSLQSDIVDSVYHIISMDSEIELIARDFDTYPDRLMNPHNKTQQNETDKVANKSQ